LLGVCANKEIFASSKFLNPLFPKLPFVALRRANFSLQRAQCKQNNSPDSIMK
jgi:hypothetical protein